MKILSWLQMSILVALIISWPLILLDVDKPAIGVLALIGGGLIMLAGNGPSKDADKH